MSSMIDMQPVEVVIVADDPGNVAGLEDALQAQGLRTQTVEGLAGVCKAARSPHLRAVIVDLELSKRRVGADHLLRMIRQLYPSLALVALTDVANRSADALAIEHRVPLLLKPFGETQAIAALMSCGVTTTHHIHPARA